MINLHHILQKHPFWSPCLRILLPSWRFFEALGLNPILYYRTRRDPFETESWVPLLNEADNSSLFDSFFSPRPAFKMACQTLIESFVSEFIQDHVNEASELPLSFESAKLTQKLQVSYELLVNLIKTNLKLAVDPPSEFQFKIEVLREINKNHIKSDLLISEWVKG